MWSACVQPCPGASTYVNVHTEFELQRLDSGACTADNHAYLRVRNGHVQDARARTASLRRADNGQRAGNVARRSSAAAAAHHVKAARLDHGQDDSARGSDGLRRARQRHATVCLARGHFLRALHLHRAARARLDVAHVLTALADDEADERRWHEEYLAAAGPRNDLDRARRARRRWRAARSLNRRDQRLSRFWVGDDIVDLALGLVELERGGRARTRLGERTNKVPQT